MAIVPLLFSSLSSLLLIAIIGYAAVKKGIMKVSECKPISTLLIYVIIPSSIISPAASLIGRKSPWFWHCRHFCHCSPSSWLVLTTFLGKATSLDGTARASLMYTPIQETSSFPWWPPFLVKNTSFMPACTMLSNNFLSGPRHGPHERERRVTLRQVLLNINILSRAIGMTLFFFQIILPPIIQNTMGMLASMIGP